MDTPTEVVEEKPQRKCLVDYCLSQVIDSADPKSVFCQFHQQVANDWVWMATHVQIQQRPTPLVVPGIKLPKDIR